MSRNHKNSYSSKVKEKQSKFYNICANLKKKNLQQISNVPGKYKYSQKDSLKKNNFSYAQNQAKSKNIFTNLQKKIKDTKVVSLL
jgi:predicted transcriptional regulator